jgi:hypothetical protein
MFFHCDNGCANAPERTSCTATAGMNVRRWRTCAWANSCFLKFHIVSTVFVFEAFVFYDRCCVWTSARDKQILSSPCFSCFARGLDTIVKSPGMWVVFTCFRVPRQYSPVGVNKAWRLKFFEIRKSSDYVISLSDYPEDGSRSHSTLSYFKLLVVSHGFITHTDEYRRGTTRGLSRPRAGNI